MELVFVEDRLEMALAGSLVPTATLRNNDRLVELEVLAQVRTGPLEDKNLLFVEFWSILSFLSKPHERRHFRVLHWVLD